MNSLLFFFASACTSPSLDETGEPSVVLPDSCTDCLLTDENNFRYQGNMDIGSVAVKEFANISIDWSGLTTSIQGKEVVPEEIDEALLLLFPRLQPQEVMHAIATDSLEQSEIGLYMLCTTDQSSCLLDEFGLLGSQPGLSQNFSAEEGSWLIILRNEETLGAVSLAFLSPEEGNESATAEITNQTATLEAEVDIRSRTPIVIKKNTAWSLDWSSLTTSGQGNPLALHRIDRLEIGHYSESLEQLEDNFFFLPEMGTEKQYFDIAGLRSIELSSLNIEGQWLIALWCDSCDNPVPPFVGSLLVIE